MLTWEIDQGIYSFGRGWEELWDGQTGLFWPLEGHCGEDVGDLTAASDAPIDVLVMCQD